MTSASVYYFTMMLTIYGDQRIGLVAIVSVFFILYGDSSKFSWWQIRTTCPHRTALEK
jgi:hypothetical protein